MRFWDTSGLVPLLLEQGASAQMRSLLEGDGEVVAWWGTSIECASAAARLRREGVLGVGEEEMVLKLLRMLEESWTEVLPSETVRREARRLLRVHSLRAGDAVQLAAATVWAGVPLGREMVTLDERLGLAARLEGFSVLPA